MTLEEFLTELRLYGGAWQVTPTGLLRRETQTNRLQCPLTALCWDRLGQWIRVGQAYQAGQMLDLRGSDIKAIIAAADEFVAGPSARPKSRLRIRLEEATKVNLDAALP